jgi:hypothetical protein
MEFSPFWEVNKCSGNHLILSILSNPRLHYRLQIDEFSPHPSILDVLDQLLAYVSFLEKINLSFWGHHTTCLCLCIPHQLFNAWTTTYGTWVRLNDILHKSLPLVCVCVYTLSLLGNGSVNMFSWRRIQATAHELFDSSFYWYSRSFSYQRRVCGSVFV